MHFRFKFWKLEPIYVTGAFQFVIEKSGNTNLLVQQYIESATEKIIYAIEAHKHQKVVPTQKFATTAHAAVYIDVDPSFLSKRQGKEFKLGTHFFKPPGQSIVRWDIDMLEQWMRAESIDNVDDELASLLQRS